MAKHVQRVVFEPAASRGLQDGINQMVGAVRPTLGPHPRRTALEKVARDRSPELLDDAGVIARRVLQLADRDANMGAMLVRHTLWRVRERMGDGAATAAVLLASVYNQGFTYLASGGNAMQLRKHLEAGIGVVAAELDRVRQEVECQGQLTRLAQGVCYDGELAEVLGEIFYIIGECGGLEIRTGHGREIRHEYVEGSYWEGGVLSPELVFDKQRLRTDLEHTAVLATDHDITAPRDLVPILDAAVQAGISSMLIIAQSMTPEALSLLLSIPNRRRILAVAVKAPPITDKGALEDIAVLTGGRAIRREAGESLRELKLGDLGRARRAWADTTYFSLTGGGGDPRAVRAHMDGLQAAQARAKTVDERQEIQKRMSKLFGGSANLYLGAATESELEARKGVAERAAEALRGAVREGVAPGGGAAFVACSPALRRRLAESRDQDARAAYRILLRAVEEPMRVIAANAGHDPDATLARVQRAGRGFGFDAEAGQVVDMAKAGVLDAVATLKSAFHAGVGAAAVALTTTALVHHAQLKEEFSP